jgi:hypothetical protein
MRQRLFNLAAAASLALCLAIAALAVRSATHTDTLYYAYGRGPSVSGAISYRGGFWFVWWEHNAGATRGFRFGSYINTPGVVPTPARRSQQMLGFDYHGDWWVLDLASNTMSRYRILILPMWFIAGVAAAPAALWGRGRWRQRRRAPGSCPVCGYDLRATPHRCPECGSAIASPPAK